jgi:hypothetical protein
VLKSPNLARLQSYALLHLCLLLLPPHAKHTLWNIKVGIEGGSISSGREQLMNDHPFWRTGDQKRVRRLPALSVVAPWGSFAARAAVRRTCYEVTLLRGDTAVPTRQRPV